MKLEEMSGSDLIEYLGELNRKYPNSRKVLATALKELKCTEQDLLLDLISQF